MESKKDAQYKTSLTKNDKIFLVLNTITVLTFYTLFLSLLVYAIKFLAVDVLFDEDKNQPPNHIWNFILFVLILVLNYLCFFLLRKHCWQKSNLLCKILECEEEYKPENRGSIIFVIYSGIVILFLYTILMFEYPDWWIIPLLALLALFGISEKVINSRPLMGITDLSIYDEIKDSFYKPEKNANG